MSKMESYNQASRAKLITANDVVVSSGHHPGHVLQFGLQQQQNSTTNSRHSHSPTSPTTMSRQSSASPTPKSSAENNFSSWPAVRTISTNNLYSVFNKDPEENKKLEAMKKKKEAKIRRIKDKNVKAVITTNANEDYDLDNVLESLGEKKNGQEKIKKKISEISGVVKKRDKKQRAEKTSSSKNDFEAASTEASEDEEDDEEIDMKFKNIELISSASAEISISKNSSLLEFKRQASRSTEDLFTPVIAKKQKWKNKNFKANLELSKDDSGHTYSSGTNASSSASSTASTAVSSTSSNNAKTPARAYNLRRKPALRPSQSLDAMKSLASTSSSMASSDPDTCPDQSAANKDNLDLAVNFPPLADSEVVEMVPKWVVVPSKTTGPKCDSSSSSYSSSAVIDASDQQHKQQQHKQQQQQQQHKQQSKQQSKQQQHPPPDVTVRAPPSQFCTASTGLPDVAAQAPMNTTTNSSSGVSSNAGDLTPPQTLSDQSFFNNLDESNKSADSCLAEAISGSLLVNFDQGTNFNNNNNNFQDIPAVVMLDQQLTAQQHEIVEFGFEVNVLDFISTKTNQLDHDDEAIVSFGSTINNNNNNQSLESGIGSTISEPNTNTSGSTGLDNEDFVQVPNYAQVVQFVATSWQNVERELERGLAQRYTSRKF